MTSSSKTAPPSSDTRSPRSRQRGFTLVELLVVLVILALIAAIAAPQIARLVGNAKGKAAKIQIERLSTILDLYYFDVGRYPTSDEGLEILVRRPAEAERWNGPYMNSADSLIDPWGNPFVYRLSADGNRPFQILTYGADGEPGGTGESADVSLQ